MVEFTRILCPVDLSEASLRPLAYAVAVARRYSAQLMVFHVVPTFEPLFVRPATLDGEARFVYPATREEVLDELRRALEGVGAGAMSADVAADAGDPSGTIVDRAVAMHADLVVMGTHGRGGVERLMIGSVAEKVLRTAPCPVLTVPPHVTSTAPGEVRFANVLCPMDFSPSSLQALGFAIDLARQAKGTVTVLHVVEWLPEHEPSGYTPFDLDKYRQHLIDDGRRRVQAMLAEEPRTGVTVRDVVLLGRPYREILRFAAESAVDLIAIGAQGRGGVGLTLFGSTTQQVVRHAESPVLTVRMPALSRSR